MAASNAPKLVKMALTGLFGLLVAVDPLAAEEMLVIAHRGASGERPEHTLAAYERAIDQGADYIEPDLVVTRDLVLVARHENELSGTTDVASREEFSDRRRSKTIDGQLTNGWFAEDFTLAELRTLRAKERIPGIRPANARFDGLYTVPTFAEILQLVRAKEAESGRRIGIYPELKHPTFLLQEAGIDSIDLLVTALRQADLDDADDPVFIQCFEVGPLKRLNAMVDVPLVLLVAQGEGPADEPGLLYEDMLTPSGLPEIATYADAIGADMRLLFGPEGVPSGLVEEAHAAGLKVHGWTLRKENAFLPPVLRRGPAENGVGDVLGMVALLAAQGLDGVFTDDPGRVVSALTRAMR
ncbi:glycerophosphodiester phosphodiesterase [Erythrobacter sp.]|uniref:glycerophosphodiester phosphodiesterase n=1 Tax=Erythrobacter sp. TaxID=1042 RepID=UPI00311FEC40